MATIRYGRRFSALATVVACICSQNIIDAFQWSKIVHTMPAAPRVENHRRGCLSAHHRSHHGYRRRCDRRYDRQASVMWSSPFNEEAWTVGDVYKDFAKLETAIRFTNAEEELKSLDRQELINEFAKKRRPVKDDSIRFIIVPVCASILIRILQKRITPLTFLLYTCVDLHFWLVVVIAPMLLLLAKNVNMPSTIVKPSNDTAPPLDSMTKEARPFNDVRRKLTSNSSKSPSESCDDHCLVLLEYWCSSVAGMALLGLFVKFAGSSSNPGVRLWLSISQLLTRLGAIASVFHCSEPLHKLQRAGQPRPLDFYSTTLQILVKSMLPVASIGIASDLSKVLAQSSMRTSIAICGSISVAFLGALSRLIRPKGKDTIFPAKSSTKVRCFQIAALVALWKNPITRAIGNFQTQSLLFQSRKLYVAILLFYSTLGLSAIIGPSKHITVMLSKIKVVYQHNLSLLTRLSQAKKMTGDAKLMADIVKWRYRVEWSEPKRLRQVVGDWYNGVGYWWFMKGTVQEKLDMELEKYTRESVVQGSRILEKIERDMANDVEGSSFRPRNRWKSDAMKSIAAKYQKCYDLQKFEDPLGIAVQQVFGIGLGFNFDHMRQLRPGEQPSMRRLQARAAKSAIHRVKQLRDPKRIELAIQNVTNEEEKEIIIKRIRDEAKKETKLLAKRLSELIPIGAPSPEDFPDANISQFRTRKHVRVRENEYMMVDEVEDRSAGKPSEKFLDGYDEYIKKEEKKIKDQKNVEDDEDNPSMIIT